MSSPVDERPPAMLGRYELVAPMAAGAIGELWRARIASGPEEGRVVAIRRIPRTERLDGPAVERLTNAGFSAMELRHPKVAAVLDVFVAEHEVGVVSEHIAGAVVQALVRPQGGKRVTVPIPAALRIVVDVLEAVDAVRGPWAELVPDPETDDERRLAAGVHGGLGPDGLWIASFGETMLLEVGLTGVALTLPSILEQPDVIAYRAPEQLDARGPVDERTDVFTAGILLWELIAGRSLFGSVVVPRLGAPGASPFAKAKVGDALQVSSAKRKVLSAPVQRLDGMPLLKGKASKALADIVARCLERDPNARFQSAREAIAAIAALGPDAVGNADSVAQLVASIAVDAPRAEAARASLASDRPTVPPVEDAHTQAAAPSTAKAPPPARAPAPLAGATRPRAPVVPTRSGEAPNAAGAVPTPAQPPAAVGHVEAIVDIDAESIPPSADVESIAPSEAPPESIPATHVDAAVAATASPPSEGVPATVVDGPSTVPVSSDSSSLPPSSDAVTIPPSTDIESLPPSGPAPAPLDVVTIAPVSDDSTMVSAVPAGIDEASLPPLIGESARPESVDIVSSFGVPSPASFVAGAELDEHASPDPIGDARVADVEERRERSRKIVAVVMGVAGLLVLGGLLRVLFASHPDDSSPPIGSASARAVAEERPRAVAAEPAPAAAPAETPPRAAPNEVAAAPVGQSATPPTSAPSATAPATAPESADTAKKAPRRKPYRPTGI